VAGRNRRKPEDEALPEPCGKNLKSLAVRALWSPAMFAQTAGEPLRRAWAHARLAAAYRRRSRFMV